MKLLLMCVFLVWWFPNGDCACTFPSGLVGSFETSSMNTITFTSSQVTIPNVHTYSTLIMDCAVQDGTSYLLKSTTTITVFSTSFHVVMCFDKIESIIQSTKFTLQQGAVAMANASNWRLKLKDSAATLTSATICDAQPYSDGTYDVLIKSGSIASTKIVCPDSILADFTYTITTGGVASCAADSFGSVCTDTSEMYFNLTKCSTIVGYSSGGVLNCVYSSSNTAGTINYVTLYNKDGSITEPTTYQFTCMAYKKTGSTIQLTQSPKKCIASQSITTISSPGSVLVFNPSKTCVPTVVIPVALSNVGAMAAGISFAVIVLIILIVLFCVFFLGRDRAKRFKCTCGRPTRQGCRNCFNSFLRGLQRFGTRTAVYLRRAKICCLRFWKECCECQGGKVDPVEDAANGEADDKRLDSCAVQVDDNKIGVPHDRELISPSNLIIQETDGETADDSKGSNAPRRLPPIESPRKVDDVDSADENTSKLPPISETEGNAASEGADAPDAVDNSPYGGKTAPETIDTVTPRITE